MKEWPSNGGQPKSDMKLGPFLIFVNLVYWDFALLVFQCTMNWFGMSIFNVFTSWAGFCYVSTSSLSFWAGCCDVQCQDPSGLSELLLK